MQPAFIVLRAAEAIWVEGLEETSQASWNWRQGQELSAGEGLRSRAIGRLRLRPKEKVTRQR